MINHINTTIDYILLAETIISPGHMRLTNEYLQQLLIDGFSLLRFNSSNDCLLYESNKIKIAKFEHQRNVNLIGAKRIHDRFNKSGEPFDEEAFIEKNNFDKKLDSLTSYDKGEDRLHNMRTIAHIQDKDKHKRKENCQNRNLELEVKVNLNKFFILLFHFPSNINYIHNEDALNVFLIFLSYHMYMGLLHIPLLYILPNLIFFYALYDSIMVSYIVINYFLKIYDNKDILVLLKIVNNYDIFALNYYNILE